MKTIETISGWKLALVLLATSAWITACDGQNISQSDPSALTAEGVDSPAGECPYAHKHGMHHHGHGQAQPDEPCDCDRSQSECPMFSEKVDRQVELLDNGIQITFTTSDSSWVEKLQTKAQKMADAHGMAKHNDLDIKSTVTKLDNGAKVVFTSDDPAAVEKLKAHASHLGEKPCAHHRHGHDWFLDHKQVTKQIEETNNGVRITLTTQEPAMIEKVQERAQHKAEKIRKHHATQDGMQNTNISVENIDNGAVLTWTSSDPDTAQKIKEWVQKKHHHAVQP